VRSPVEKRKRLEPGKLGVFNGIRLPQSQNKKKSEIHWGGDLALRLQSSFFIGENLLIIGWKMMMNLEVRAKRNKTTLYE